MWSDQDIMMLEGMLASNVDRTMPPPAPIPGKKWAMVVAGSQPTVAVCPGEFPGNTIHESAGADKEIADLPEPSGRQVQRQVRERGAWEGGCGMQAGPPCCLLF